MAEAATLQEQTRDFHIWEHELQAAPEERKSFDVLASVRMFRYDLAHSGRILPETRAQVANEELSYIVEGIDRASRTEFPLKRSGDDLLYAKNGKWLSYSAMVIAGAQVAQSEAEKDYRRQFLAKSENDNVAHMLEMRKLKPGESYVYCSPYDYEAEARYGIKFMEECGRFPDRKMGFIYRAYCNQDGDVILQSQTVDNSRAAGFQMVRQAAKENPDIDMDGLVAAYDSVFDGNVYAGRLQSEIGENAWQQILKQRDLIEFFLNKLEAIAAMPIHEAELTETVKRHVYGVWAAFKQRLDAPQTIKTYWTANGSVPIAGIAMLEQEVHHAFTDFAVRGVALVGCGGKIELLQGESGFLDADPESVFKAIFGTGKNKAEDAKIPSTINCIACKRQSPKEKVVKEKSWCCPHCQYEVDICTGKVLHVSVKPKPKSRRNGANTSGRTKKAPPKPSIVKQQN